MKVSIVIPTYYRSKDLADLFESLLRQSVKPLEVIVVDDTPTNVIERLCKIYHNVFEKLNIKLIYVRNYRERSAAIARNIGASMAKGEIILFLDSDIILHNDYIKRILEVFEAKKEALGVQGWILHRVKRRTLYLDNILRKIFLLVHLTKNSCGIFEYPYILTEIINCSALSGSNMAFKRVIFNEFRFDENLLKYSYMEDLLFTHLIYKKYPSSLFITPYAKCIHKVSGEGRIKTSILEHSHLRACRKYVLKKLFGTRGVIIFGWQTLGLLTFNMLRKIRRLLRRVSIE
ncbi:MAG: glycosyltransferase family 2 protein [Candidatus Bathyarchaeia archaeon]